MQDNLLPTSSPIILHSSPPPSEDDADMADDEDESDFDFGSDIDEFLGRDRVILW